MADGLLLRDVHVPASPSWWPPAPGWWMVGAVGIVVAIVAYVMISRRRARREAALRLFDDALAGATTPMARIAAASELLRRASRRKRADADRLDGDDWLAWLDSKAARFSDGPGRLVLDGAFRPTLDHDAAERAVALARARFAELMGTRA